MQTVPHPTRTLSRALGAWLLLAIILGLTTLRASERRVTLEAIHSLENPRNLTRPGPRGELGAYQFRPETWRMHTTLPFAHAHDRTTSDYVAEKHYDWLRRGLESARVAPTPYNIALAWNSGLAAVVAGKSPRSAHRYAERAANLAEAIGAERQVAMGR